MKDWELLAARVPYEPQHARPVDRREQPWRVVLAAYAATLALCAIVLVWRFR